MCCVHRLMCAVCSGSVWHVSPCTCNDAVIAGAGVCSCPCFPALAFLDLWPPFPLGHHPRPVRIARNLPVPQKWYKRTDHLHLSCWCIVGHSWRRTLAIVLKRWHTAPAQSSEALNDSAAQWVSGLLVGVRAPRRCLLAPVLLKPRSSSPAGACAPQATSTPALLAPC